MMSPPRTGDLKSNWPKSFVTKLADVKASDATLQAISSAHCIM